MELIFISQCSAAQRCALSISLNVVLPHSFIRVIRYWLVHYARRTLLEGIVPTDIIKIFIMVKAKLFE